MAIGEIILGSFLASYFQVLFEKLTSLALGYAQREGISTALLEEWKGMLVTINAVLADTEDRQLSGNPLVKLWLYDVRDLAYDMEDLLDEFAIKAAQVESRAESSTSKGLKKWKFSFFGPDKSSGLNPNLLSLVSETKVQEINGRLKAIVTRKARLSLRENVADRSNSTNKRDPTTSLPEPQFFGREKEEAQILKLLISEVENSNATLSIVPIVGMGGVGKTALAQRLYNDARVYSCFEMRAWVCVSDVFDVHDITKTILRSISGLSHEGEDLNGLQVKLKDKLSGKKFLVVLDDIWNEKYEKWTSLLKPFEAGVKGSKIIITTRNLAVVSITRASPYPLKELSLDNCTSLLAFHALGAANFESHPDFETIGKKIAERCKGLPLAAKLLGGALRSKSNPDEWEDTLNNRIWDLLMAENDEVLPVLKLSYVHLPSYLKRCFAYCAVFPKDYEIERDELVLLSMAEGLLDGHEANENILRLGQKHFDELVSRSFLQQSSVGTLPCQLDRLMKLEIHSCAHLNISTSVVRLPSLRELYLEDCNKEILKSFVNLTSLTILRIENLAELVCFDHGYMSRFVKLKELLIVGCEKLTYLWQQDGNELLNLTCLQKLAIESCPRFTSFLAREGEMELPYNLERMELSNCESLEKLPSKMHTLKNLSVQNCPKIWGVNIPRDGPSSNNPMYQLESLDIGRCESLTSFPFAKGRFAALKTLIIRECKGVESLEEIIVAKSLESLDVDRCENLRSLPQCLHVLSHLIELCIIELEIEDFPPLPITLSSLRLWNCPKIKSIANCNIASCKNLTQLWISNCPALEIEEFPPLPITLLSLILSNCPKIKALPNQWHHLTSLQSIFIYNCPNINCFPTGGFPPNLRDLKIWGCENVKQPVREWGLPLLTSLDFLAIDFGSSMGGGEGEKVSFPEEDAWSLLFPSSLTDLRIYNMRKVERLSSGLCNHLSSLTHLFIYDCPKLRYLPYDGLPPSLQRLEIKRCSNLKEGCSKLTGHNWPLIQHIPFILIDGVRIR